MHLYGEDPAPEVHPVVPAVMNAGIQTPAVCGLIDPNFIAVQDKAMRCSMAQSVI